MLAIFSGYQMIRRKRRERKKKRMHLPTDCFATLLVRDQIFLSVAFDSQGKLRGIYILQAQEGFSAII